MLGRHPETLELTLDGLDVLKAVLLDYKMIVLSGMVGKVVDDVTLACDYDRQVVEGYGDVSAEEWPFVTPAASTFFELMQSAGLYDPEVDPDTKIEMTAEVRAALEES